MKVSNYSPIKCFYRRFSKFLDNQLLASRQLDIGFLEIIYWSGNFEIYLRLPKKRYGYFLKTYPKLNQAINFLENIKEIDLSKLLPSDIFGSPNEKKGKFPFWLIPKH